jgi:GNAT superfamily N-acetyltransferase
VTAVIREAKKSDLEAMLSLYACLDQGDVPGLDAREAERLFDRIGAYPDYSVYVAESGGEVVGVFALLIMDNLAHAGAPSGIVEGVVVHPRWRGQGVGRAMMQFAMERCRKAGCYKLALSSSVERQPAHEFYESLGFERHGYSFVVEFHE